jgi:hypothetical protein
MAKFRVIKSRKPLITWHFWMFARRPKGHTLCITKQEIDYLFDVEDELYTGLWLFAKKVAKAVKKNGSL